MRKGGGKSKGSSFEREFCKLLSLWWTRGESDCAFWRTAGSGGRATVRGRKGMTTSGAAGDICATDNKGIRLMKAFTFELKCGYNKVSIMDCIDTKNKKNQFAQWLKQASFSAVQSRSRYWAIVHKRSHRKTLMFIPADAAETFRIHSGNSYYLGRIKTGRGPVVILELDGVLRDKELRRRIKEFNS